MEPLSILIVGRDPATCDRLVEDLAPCGLDATVCTAEAAAASLRHRGTGVVILHPASIGDDDAVRIVTETAAAPHPVPCLVVLADPGVDETVAWMRRGAFGVVRLQAHRESLRMQLEQALRHRELSARNAELERSLEVHERLAMIGKLAAGVAHELNNPLDGVLRYVNLSIEKLPREAPQVTYLMEARRGLRRMADIIKDLLQFSRNASLETADEDAERLARDSVTQVVGAVRERTIDATFEFPPSGVHLPRGMFQVFGNLAKNAVDAMPDGGTIRVAATVASGRVLITVSDTGTGIPDEIRDRIFEPFFTTKEVGRGTGLGLPICQRIVERLGGTLSLETEVGHGTTVRMDLPQRRPAVAPAAPQQSVRRPAAPAQAEGAF